MKQQQIDTFVENAKLSEVSTMLSALVSYHGVHTVLAILASDCAHRAHTVLHEWQDGITAQSFEASRQIVAEAADKIQNLATATNTA